MVSIRATNIFRKEDRQWKILGHHVALLSHPARAHLTATLSRQG
jgi:hypothetical protein